MNPKLVDILAAMRKQSGPIERAFGGHEVADRLLIQTIELLANTLSIAGVIPAEEVTVVHDIIHAYNDIEKWYE